MAQPERHRPDELTQAPVSENIHHEIGQVTAERRAALLGQAPRTFWITGLSASGKSTISKALERRLVEKGRPCYVLDGDNLRHGLNRDLGFTPADRQENIRRAAEVARLMNDAGLIVVTALISPYREDREMARRIVGASRMIEVYLSTPLEVCERRDPRGLYRRARAGELRDFTGVSAPYEAPTAPDVTLDTAVLDVEECVARLLERCGVARG